MLRAYKMNRSALSINASTLPHLPPDMLFEILLRLPVKSLLQFKSISKYFYFLIDDPFFIYVHHNLSLLRPGATTILFSFPVQTIARKSVMGIYTINSTESHHGELQANRIRHWCGGEFRIGIFGSSANGLIFLPINHLKRALCNLSTRQHIFVDAQGGNLHSGRVDLGFDSDRKTYKALSWKCYITQGRGVTKTKVWVLTLGVDKSWREVKSSSDFRRRIDSDGIIYSIDMLIGTGCPFTENPFTISAFNVRTETFSEIYFPEEQNLKAPDISLTEVNGRLAIIRTGRQIPSDNLIELWTLEKSKEWMKHTTRVPLEKGQIIIRPFFSCSSKNWIGEIMVLIQMGDSYWMFFNELGNQVWRKLKIFGLHDYLTSFPIVNWDQRLVDPNFVELTESLFVPKLDLQQ